MKVWTCTIGPVARERLPEGADQPMRAAVEAAFHVLTGEQAQACFSGWEPRFTVMQQAVICGKPPERREIVAEILAELAERGLTADVARALEAGTSAVLRAQIGAMQHRVDTASAHSRQVAETGGNALQILASFAVLHDLGWRFRPPGDTPTDDRSEAQVNDVLHQLHEQFRKQANDQQGNDNRP